MRSTVSQANRAKAVRPNVSGGRWSAMARLAAPLLAALPILNIQCGDEARRLFREQAFPAIEQGAQSIIHGDSEAGLQQILDGIVSGVLTTEPVDTTYGTDGGSD